MEESGSGGVKADIFAAQKTGTEYVRWIHDSYLTEWQLLLEKTTSKVKTDDERNELVRKLLEVVATKVLFTLENGIARENEEVEEDEGCPGENRRLDCQEEQVRILTVTCNNKFIDSIKATVVSWSAQPKKHETLGVLLAHLYVFCDEVLERIPFLGVDVLLNLVCAAIGAAASSTVITRGKPELLGQFTTLQQKIQEINKSLEENNKPKKKDYFFDQHDQLLHSMEPPENFREIPVVPTLEELICEHKPFLRPNKVIGPYRSSEHYLDVHFRLLREDFVRPLRYAVQEFMKNKNEFIRGIGRRRANREQDSSVRMYNDIMFIRSEGAKDNNSTENYLFSLPQRLVTKVNWDKSKRLLPGCLVMLTADLGKTALFAVTQQPPFDPKKKHNTGGIDSRRQELANGIVRLVIETGKDLLMLNRNKTFLMFECEAFFEAYRHNLAILQTLTCLENDGDQPNCVNKVIVQASSELGPPLYLKTDSSIQFPISCKEPERNVTNGLVLPQRSEPRTLTVSPFHPEIWPAEEIQEKMNVDPDQYEALKAALSSELAVIQGPPGTGKTYVGLQIVKTLLHNKAKRILPKSPFLVICYTNHALDQFLELLLAVLPSVSMVRVGGQSKSEVLQNYTLQQHRRKFTREYMYLYDELGIQSQKRAELDAGKRVRRLEELLSDLTLENAALSSPDGIFNFHKMRVGDRLQKILPYGLWHTMANCEWLGFRPDNFLVPDFQVKEIVLLLFVVKPKSKKDQSRRRTDPVEAQVGKAQNPKENATEEEEKPEDSEYNMDELLEHRLVENDDPWESIYSQNPIRRADVESASLLYLDKCSTQGCQSMSTLIDDQFKKAHQQYILMGPGQALDDKAISTHLIDQLMDLSVKKVDYGNRANLLSTIFGLYNEGRLALPSVDKVFREAEDGRGYMVSNQKVIQYPIRLKWAIYFKVVEISRTMAAAYRSDVARQLEEARKDYAKERNKLDGFILRNTDIIGMTTTGAAKMHELLEIAKPQVVIVEEAAEILEAHIVTSLTEDCKHLILIGDHLQLRPSTNVFELWKKYRLNVSLFERMILNGVPLCTLKTQHRMRSEISNLIIGPIYDELHDHPKVHDYPHIKGIRKSLFFVNHHEHEQTDGELLSKSNYHEADFLVSLCEYLLKQGYEHKQITILTTYTGQMFLLRKIFPVSCRGVRITCVDNFQGEENDIILLSLVRSNDEDKVGFVAIDNRICVALSRARHGLYVLGNMDGMVVASKTWKKIQRKLKQGGNIGNTLELVCEQHGKVTEVKFGQDFKPLASGGCDQKCDAKLQCGHNCTLLCHALDQTHEKFNCMQRCIKKCESGHQCIGRCSNQCPRCLIRELKSLPCGHEGKVPCFQDVSTVLCQVLVPRKLECEHEHEIECHVDVQTVECKTPVEKTLPCGHVRMVDCHMSPEQVKCTVEDEKTLNCGHSRLLQCYQPVDTVDCDVPVEKTLNCGHKITLKCCHPIAKVDCKEDVEKKLPCGHCHVLKCFQPVKGVKCQMIIDVVLPGCSHIRKLACFKSGKAWCTEKCGKAMPCGHPCPKDCHVQDDPDHQLFVCKEKCVRSCDSGHPCKWGHACFKKCLPCEVPVSLKLECGHEVKSECSKSTGTVNCLEKVKKMLPCGHEQLVACHVAPQKHSCTFQIVNCDQKCSAGHPCSFDHACYEGCPPCEEQVPKNLPCGHVADLSCHDVGRMYKCKEMVVKRLTCGHSENSPCSVDPRLIACKKMVPMTCGRCTLEVVVECRKTELKVCDECKKVTDKPRGDSSSSSNNNPRLPQIGSLGLVSNTRERGNGGRQPRFKGLGSANKYSISGWRKL